MTVPPNLAPVVVYTIGGSGFAEDSLHGHAYPIDNEQ